MMTIFRTAFVFTILVLTGLGICVGQDNPLVYEGDSGPGVGKHIVFIAADHEYRGEQSLPMLARILAKHHGFKCTVLFSVDPDSGEIVPGCNNIPGTEVLDDADLAVVFLRFQDLPAKQMKPIIDYLDRAGPIVGLRTSTHAFKIPASSQFAKYSHEYKGDEYQGGFGRQVLGETWAGHYGKNHVMSTRLDIVPDQKSHPILTGVEKPWVVSGGYWTEPMDDSLVLAMTQPLTTMEQDSAPAKDKQPCPNAWIREYAGKNGESGRVFTTTSGASEDILNDDFRRMLVNACYWAAEMENEIDSNSEISFVGPYRPSTFRMNSNYYVGVKPTELAGWDSPIMPDKPLKKAAPKKRRQKKASAPKDTQLTSVKSSSAKASSRRKAIPSPPPKSGVALELELGDHICIVGNALGEAMQHQNQWETLLYQAFPDKELSVRNLCFAGDTIDVRLRSLDFGDPDSHLTHSKADAVLFFFGSNESFAGEQGREEFHDSLEELVKQTKQQDYSESGRGTKVVLVSPIAFEMTGDPNLPAGKLENERLKSYTDTMRRVAEKHQVGFVDLFTPTQELFGESPQRLTRNGIHLNEVGYQALAPILMKGLFGKSPENSKNADKLKVAIDDKNFHWWHRYRAVNGFSIYGTRGKAGSDGTYNNRDVMERERTILDQMTANRDARIWEIAQGNAVPDQVDDSNTIPFINPKTNVGGPDDPNRKRGKLGSLDYSPAAEQAKKFKLPEGFEINLFATEEDFPELANPVALNFDSKGRMWVSTMPSYPHWKPKTKLEDKLLILTDNDKDGRADKCHVFADGLYLPTGFELGQGGAYVAQQPDILFLKDEDGDDVADTRIRLITGLGSADSHHGIAAFEWGPDGALYFNEGTFKYSQVESPYGLTRLNEAGVWRYHPKTHEATVHVNYAFANPWGHVYDKWGQDFVADASGGQNYWATIISGKTVFPQKHPGGGHYKRTLKLPKNSKVPDAPKLLVKRTRPSSGCELVSSRNFPDEMQGNYLLNNVIGDLAVLNHRMEEKGSGYFASEVPPVVECEDGNFRPVDLQFGPDGALYIVDWHNALIGHLQHNLREPNRDHSHGRIWRVTYKGRPLIDPPNIAEADENQLLELLKQPEDRTRYRVRRELANRPTEQVIEATKSWMDSLSKEDKDYERMLLEGLWIHQTHNIVDEALLSKLLSAEDYHARAAATRVLSYWHNKVSDPLAMLKPRINDDQALVRAEAVRAASFLEGDAVTESVLDVLNHEMDENLEYLLDETMKVLEQ